VVLKGGRLSEFGGRSINAAADHAELFRSNNMENIPRIVEVKKWY
jgi:hypothetical protein